MSLPGILPVEGGEPLLVDGQLVGAIGVSGASAEQDGEIARAGAAMIARPSSKTGRPPG
jgi:glc operon protein GlcG